MKKTMLLTAVAAALTLSSGTIQANEMGKCYGAAEKGKNDCGAKDGSHSCAGQSVQDYSMNDWKKMSKEECEKANCGTNKCEWEAIKK